MVFSVWDLRFQSMWQLMLFWTMVCRVKTNPKNAINEHFLPRFLDFIVWGHEHECLVDPQVSCLNISYVSSDRHVLCSANLIWILIFFRKFQGWDFIFHNQDRRLQHHLSMENRSQNMCFFWKLRLCI